MEKYSVLMAVYHKEKPENFQLAVESMLEQTVPPDEFVLVCDGPLTPQLDAVIADLCRREPELFHILRLEKNCGLGVALNVGLSQCRNELVARMDSDDIAVPHRMEMQLAAMETNPHVSVLGGQIGEFQSGSSRIHAYRIVPMEESDIRVFLRFRNPMNHMTVVLRRSHVLQVGNYPNLPGFEDYVLWATLLANGYSLRNIRQVCCRARADAGIYSRRGGIRYFRNSVAMEQHLLRLGLICRGRFWRNVAVRFGGTILLSAGFRRAVFLRFLRRKALAGGNGSISPWGLPVSGEGY